VKVADDPTIVYVSGDVGDRREGGWGVWRV